MAWSYIVKIYIDLLLDITLEFIFARFNTLFPACSFPVCCAEKLGGKGWRIQTISLLFMRQFYIMNPYSCIQLILQSHVQMQHRYMVPFNPILSVSRWANILKMLRKLFLKFLYILACCGKESTCQWGGARDTILIPGLGRSPEGRNGDPPQYPCLEYSMDRGSLAGYSPQDHEESDMTEWLSTNMLVVKCLHKQVGRNSYKLMLKISKLCINIKLQETQG